MKKPQPRPDPEFICGKTFQSLAGISRKTFDKEVAAGRITARRCGRRLVIHRDELQAWFNSLDEVAA